MNADKARSACLQYVPDTFTFVGIVLDKRVDRENWLNVEEMLKTIRIIEDEKITVEGLKLRYRVMQHKNIRYTVYEAGRKFWLCSTVG